MANTTSSMLLYNGSMLTLAHMDCLLRHARLVPRSHSFPATLAVANNRASNISFGGKWGHKGKIQFVRNCSTSEFAIANDEKYGNKQVVSLSPRLYDYLLKNVREPEILKQLREETASMRGSQMQVSLDQAQLLAMLVQILGAERCIEVGVYTVDVKYGPAADTLQSLILHGEADR